MADYQEYIGALRKCAKEHENDRTSTGQIIVSNLCEVIADLLEDLSSSGKPNKSIEEKCPCYYCEHFEIKGWSHCKIHEGAYGDSRCNDYHKIKQEPNKSENPTGSDDCISRAEAQTEIEMNASRYTIAKERCGMGQVEWSDQLIKVSDAVDIIRHLPPATPQEPILNKLKEKDEAKAVRYEGDGYADGAMVYDMAFCPNCEHEFEEDSENWECDFCPNCGQKLRW